MALFEILLKFFFQNKRLFFQSFIFTNIFALIFYFSVDRIYESQLKVVQSEKANNVLNLNSFANFLPSSLSSDPRGAQIFSSIIKSKNFYDNLSQETVVIGSENKTIHNFLLDFYNLNDKTDNIESHRAHQHFIKKIVAIRHDKLTGIVTINVFSKDPIFSQLLAQLIIEKLEDRLISYNLNSKGSNKDFIINRVSEVEKELRLLEKDYVQFLDSNLSANSAYFINEKVRLERKMQGKENLLNQLYSELEINKIEERREDQILLDIIEQPTFNELKIYPRLSIVLFLSLLISFSIPFALRFKTWNN